MRLSEGVNSVTEGVASEFVVYPATAGFGANSAVSPYPIAASSAVAVESPQARLLRIFGERPLLIDASRLYHDGRAAREVSSRARKEAKSGGIAIVDVTGILGSSWYATSYSSILEQIEAAVADSSIAAVILHIDSPGGETANAFETADAIFELSKAKPIWSVVDTGAFSAAYLLASQTSRIILPEKSGGVGSIGVYTAHIDYSEMLHKEGIAVTLIHEGEGKVDANPYEPLSKSARGMLEEMVKRDYGFFVEAVSRGRVLATKDIVGLGARLYFGRDALDTKLADGVGTLRSAIAELREYLTSQARKGSPRASAVRKGANMEQETIVESNGAETAASVNADQIRAQALADARAEASHIAELCEIAGKPQLATKFIAQGLDSSAVMKKLLELRAKDDEKNATRSAILPEAGTASEVRPAKSLAARMKEMVGEKS